MRRLRVVFLMCLLCTFTALSGVREVIAQTPGAPVPRSHDIEYVKQLRTKKLTIEQRRQAAVRQAVKKSKVKSSDFKQTGSNTVVTSSVRGN